MLAYAEAFTAEVIAAAMPKLEAFQKQLPDGFIFRFAGEQKEQVSGFADLTTVLLICVSAIYLALLAQFKHAFKPLIVFAAIPYGVVGAIFSLAIMGQPFGFMAFLGIISLIRVIVSHIIVLFEFIEERREEGEELELALIDAGVLRLRPMMITVVATVIVSVGCTRRAALGASLLYADWGTDDRHFRDAWARSRPLLLRRAGPEADPLGTRRAAWFCCSGETLSDGSNIRIPG